MFRGPLFNHPQGLQTDVARCVCYKNRPDKNADDCTFDDNPVYFSKHTWYMRPGALTKPNPHPMSGTTPAGELPVINPLSSD